MEWCVGPLLWLLHKNITWKAYGARKQIIPDSSEVTENKPIRFPLSKDGKIWTSTDIKTLMDQTPLKYLNVWVIKILHTNKIQTSKNTLLTFGW